MQQDLNNYTEMVESISSPDGSEQSREASVLYPWRHLLATAGLFATGLFFCAAVGIRATGGSPFFIFLGFAIATATLQLCALWAALGAGPYFLRSVLALLLGGFVAMSGWIGVCVGLGLNDVGDDAFQVLWSVLAFGPLAWFSSQFPYFVFAWKYRWRLGNLRDAAFVSHPLSNRNSDETRGDEGEAELSESTESPIHRRHPKSQEYKISDIMAATSLCAIVLACTRFAFPDTELLNEFPLGVLIVGNAFSIAFSFLFGVPCIWLALRQGADVERGCRGISLFTFGILFLTLLCLTPFPAIAVGAVPLMFLIGLPMFLFAFPLMFAKQAGLVLWTGARQKLHSSDLGNSLQPSGVAEGSNGSRTSA
ncbi:MAG: hypothetical protein AAF483_18300 [Planctomycetota bacterium]